MELEHLFVPPAVKQLFQHRNEAGFDAGYAWVFSRSELVIFDPLSAHSPTMSQSLPYASGSAKHFVCILPSHIQGRLGVLLVTDNGNAALWPDFGSPNKMEPLTSRIAGSVACVSACPAPMEALAIAGLEDGSMQLLTFKEGSNPIWQVMYQPVLSATAAEMAENQAVKGLCFISTANAVPEHLLVLRSTGVEKLAISDTCQTTLLQYFPLAQELEMGLRSGPFQLITLATVPNKGDVSNVHVLASCLDGIYLITLEKERLGITSTNLVAEVLDSPVGSHWCAAMGSDNKTAIAWGVGGKAAFVDTVKGSVVVVDTASSQLLSATAHGRGWLLIGSGGEMYQLQIVSNANVDSNSGRQAVHVNTSQPSETAALVAGSAASESNETIFQILNSVCQGQLSVPQMSQQLISAGALRGIGSANPVARFSRHVLDTLPKIFGAGAETVGDQLQGKLALHNVLLQCLADGGCLAQLQPATLRSLFEDGQKLRALIDLRDLESRLQDQRKSSGYEGYAFPLQEVVVAAGRRCMGKVLGGGHRTPWEVFYTCPSVTTSIFFVEVADVVGSLTNSPGAAVQQFETVSQLSAAVKAALSGAYQQRTQYQQWFPQPASSSAAGVSEPEWAVGDEIKGALQALSEACIRLYRVLLRESPERVSDCVNLSFDLTERLLNAFAASISAVERHSNSTVLSEYHHVRDILLRHLLDHSVRLCQDGNTHGRQLLQHVESLGVAHSGYALLYDLCAFTGDRNRLYHFMSSLSSDQEKHTMTTYVFKRLLYDDRCSDLLDLPAEFDNDLASWLASTSAPDAELRRKLRWIHDLRTGDYASSARSLNSVVRDELVSIDEAQRLLALNKLAVWAGSSQWPTTVCEELLPILSLVDKQRELLELQAKAFNDGTRPAVMDCGSLMTDLLKCTSDAEKLTAAAVEVYSLASPEQRSSSREAFEIALKKLIRMSAWEEIASKRNDISEEDFWSILYGQPLFLAIQAFFARAQAANKEVIALEVNEIVEGLTSQMQGSAKDVARMAFQAGYRFGAENI